MKRHVFIYCDAMQEWHTWVAFALQNAHNYQPTRWQADKPGELDVMWWAYCKLSPTFDKILSLSLSQPNSEKTLCYPSYTASDPFPVLSSDMSQTELSACCCGLLVQEQLLPAWLRVKTHRQRSICFHELNHKLLVAPVCCMCVSTLTRRSHDWYMWQNLCHLRVLATSWERCIVKISAICPFPTDCRQMWQKWMKSPTLTKSRLLPFPRLVCTWQANKWRVCTISTFRCVESPSIRIAVTRQIFVKCNRVRGAWGSVVVKALRC